MRRPRAVRCSRLLPAREPATNQTTRTRFCLTEAQRSCRQPPPCCQLFAPTGVRKAAAGENLRPRRASTEAPVDWSVMQRRSWQPAAQDRGPERPQAFSSPRPSVCAGNGSRLTCRPPFPTVHRPAARSDAPQPSPRSQPPAAMVRVPNAAGGQVQPLVICQRNQLCLRHPHRLPNDRSAALMPTTSALLSAFRARRSAKGCGRRKPPPAQNADGRAGGTERDARRAWREPRHRRGLELQAASLFSLTHV